MGNLTSESPRMETLNARFATPVAGMRSDPVTKVRSFRCIIGSIRAKKLQNLTTLAGLVGEERYHRITGSFSVTWTREDSPS
jgi:hypothetical protein